MIIANVIEMRSQRLQSIFAECFEIYKDKIHRVELVLKSNRISTFMLAKG